MQRNFWAWFQNADSLKVERSKFPFVHREQAQRLADFWLREYKFVIAVGVTEVVGNAEDF